MRLLLLEDDYELRRALGRRLRADGYAVDEVRSIAQAQKQLAETHYDCVVLDREVPDGDATGLLDRWNAGDERPPVFLLTEPGCGNGQLECLAAGADDSMAKPICVEELIVRVRRMIIRHTPGGARVHVGNVTMDRARRLVLVDGHQVRLSPLQYSVCQQLAIRAGGVVEQGWLLEHCWDARRDPFSDPLHSQVTRLRSIFRGHLVIESVRGSGYLMRAPSETPPAPT